MTRSARNPYIVGRWVIGPNHYGRQRVIQFLLEIDSPATWVVGTRRMGKTSLLRQLEWLADVEGSDLVPIFWDLQGCANPADLTYELIFTLEGAAERLAPFDFAPAEMEERGAAFILRSLSRAISRQGKKLFLLIDEAEVLIDIGQRDPAFLGQLRKAIQDPWQRTVITSTKLLTRLNEADMAHNTSPFLFGFQMVNLWQLDPQSAQDLVVQAASPTPLPLAAALVDDILVHTNRHPYLVQYLCYHLFAADEQGNGFLRPIDWETDLEPDHLLAGFFNVDFQHLTPTERRILLTIGRDTMLSDLEISARLPDLDSGRVHNFLYGLNKLGYVRQVYGQWSLGNEFLQRWVQHNLSSLETQLESSLSDANVESILARGRTTEIAYLRQESDRLQNALLTLQDAATAGTSTLAPQELARQIESLRQQLAGVAREMKEVVNSELIANLPQPA